MTDLLTDDHLGALRHCEVYHLAAKFDIPDLKNLAVTKLATHLSSKWVSSEFPEIVVSIYGNAKRTDKDIRWVVLSAAKGHIDELVKMQAFMHVLFEDAEFSSALVVGLAEVLKPQQCRCPFCGTTVFQKL
jgi:hypothetical protein